MKRRQIAFFTTDWNYALVGETLDGISQYLSEHPDINVRVFDCFGIDQQSISDILVYEIYNQAVLEEYDGIIVQTHQIVLKDVLRDLEKRIRESGIPAITIGVNLGDLPQIKSDDAAALREITDHVIEKHNARRLWFLKGLEIYDGGGEAILRRQGFMDSCAAHGIPEENIRILDGDWKNDSGVAAALEILAQPEDQRPDALICANDDMAQGALDVLRQGGIDVPGQISVTGFDGVFTGALCTPRLSTVNRNFTGLAYSTMDLLVKMINGERVPDLTLAPHRADFYGSCGCNGNEHQLISEIKDRFFRQTQFLRHFYLTQDKLTADLFAASSLRDVMLAVEKHWDIFGSGAVRIYLDARYYDAMEAAGRGEMGEVSLGRFSDEFVLAADSKTGIAAKGFFRRLPRGATQTQFSDRAEEPLTLYYALRYGNIMLGILTMDGICEAAEMNLHESIINLIVLATETVRQRLAMHELNEKLSQLYVTDQLTGLYNRFGIASMGQPLFDALTKAGKPVRYLFLDVDDMKNINDRCGHEAGDLALRATADILRRVCSPGDFMMRYGGDEFVAFGPAVHSDPEGQVKKLLDEFNKNSTLPFRLDLSVGEYVRSPEETNTLDDCLKEADRRMYEAKKRKKYPHS